MIDHKDFMVQDSIRQYGEVYGPLYEKLWVRTVLTQAGKQNEELYPESLSDYYGERDLNPKSILSQYLLQTKHYDDVQVEYLVEKESLGIRPATADDALLKNKKLYVDIVVEKKGEYALLELKFPLYLYSDFHPKRFGEDLISDKTTSTAQNETCHNYWKDVRRIELIKKRYNQVVGGIALLLTDARAYWQAPGKNV